MRHQRQVAENGKLLARGDELLAVPAHNAQENTPSTPRKSQGKPQENAGKASSWLRAE